MKTTYAVLAAVFAMLAIAPRSSAQGTSKMTVGIAVSAPATVDTMPLVIAIPDSAAWCRPWPVR